MLRFCRARALIVIDMLQSYEHEDAEALRENVASMLPTLSRLVERAGAVDAPVIYVNDSFGDWRGDRTAFLEEIGSGPHARLVEPVLPADGAPLITNLIRSEEIESVVLAGQVTEQCVLYSALDAHIRHIPVVVPRDAVAHIDTDLAEAALEMMRRNMAAEMADAADIAF